MSAPGERQRADLLRQALYRCQWHLVSNLVQDGVGQKLLERTFWTAVRRNQWDCARHIARLDKDSEKISVVIAEDARNCRWYHVTEILKAGASSEVEETAVRSVIKQGAWEHIPEIVKCCSSSMSRTKVIELVRDTVSTDSLDIAFWRAVRRFEWDKARTMSMLEPGPEKRNIVIADDVLFQRWDWAIELMDMGVGVQEEHMAIRGVMEHGMWGYVPLMVNKCKNPESKHFAVMETVRYGRWKYVFDMVHSGNLNSDQIDDIYKSAVTSRQWQFVAELLCVYYGGPGSSWAVEELFMWNKWSLVTNLFKEGTISKDLKMAVLNKAALHNQSEAFMSVVSIKGVTDFELCEVMKRLISGRLWSFLYWLIKNLRAGCRVFKHLCWRRGLPYDAVCSMFRELTAKAELDLALHLVVTQQIWCLVVEIFDDDCVSTRASRFAFVEAVKAQAWGYVLQMLQRGASGRDRRSAFLAAARCGEWKWVLKFYRKHAVSSKDIEVVLKMCVVQEGWKFVVKLMKLCCDNEMRDRMLVYIVSKAISSCKWMCIKRIYETYLDTETDHIFLGRGMYFGDFQEYSAVHALFVETDILQTSKLWRYCIPPLARYFDESFHEDSVSYEEDVQTIGNALGKVQSTLRIALVKWCMKNSFQSLAVLFAIVLKRWNLLNRLMEKVQSSIDIEVLHLGIRHAIASASWVAVIAILKYTSIDSTDADIFEDIIENGQLHIFMEKLRENGLVKWIVKLASWMHDWEYVERELDTSSNEELIVYALREATSRRNWVVVSKLIDKCKDDDQTFSHVLRTVIDFGVPVTAQKIMSRIDPLSATKSGRTLLRCAVVAIENREEMVRLCINFGVSTHQCLLEENDEDNDIWSTFYVWKENSPIKLALYNGQLPLVKLLFESGSCTNHALYSLKTNTMLMSRLKSQGRHDIVKYIEIVASSPRTLQDLTRMAISHLIGCCPGRCGRVRSLPVPEFIRNYILFEDILCKHNDH